MAKRVGMVALSCVWLIGVAVAWAQEEPKKPAGITRSFDRFEQEAAISEGIWVEGAAGYVQDVVKDPVGNKTTASSDFGAVRASYGMDMFEAGITFPFWQHNEVEVRQGRNVATRGEEDLGDLSLFAKVLPVRTEWFDAGAALQVITPTGDEDKGTGIGRFGFLPVATVAAHLAPIDVRAHGGYRFVTDITPTAREAIVYGGGIFYTWNDQLALRSEINGAIVDVRGKENLDLIVWQPGVDVRLPMEGYDVLLRPTGTYGINDESPDWGFGGSITVWMRP
ncbi:hypothetical protein HRbin30_02287 [bacterium HR30]|nr:hypothetical protein HRbin30_02287 [bacterium HR30]